MGQTAKQRIIKVMEAAQRPLAVHEFRQVAHEGCLAISENSLSARLRELRTEGKVVAQVRDGKPFKEWLLTQPKEASCQTAA